MWKGAKDNQSQSKSPFLLRLSPIPSLYAPPSTRQSFPLFLFSFLPYTYPSQSDLMHVRESLHSLC